MKRPILIGMLVALVLAGQALAQQIPIPGPNLPAASTPLAGSETVVIWQPGTGTNAAPRQTAVSNLVNGSVFGSQAPNTVYAGPLALPNANPAFRHLVGADLPTAAPSSLGGIFSFAPLANQFLTGIATTGTPISAQPSFSNLSGSSTCSQLPPLVGDATSTAGTCTTAVVNLSNVKNASLANSGLVNSGLFVGTTQLVLGTTTTSISGLTLVSPTLTGTPTGTGAQITIGGLPCALASSCNPSIGNLSNIAGGTVVGNPTSGSAAPSATSTPVLGIAATVTGTVTLADGAAAGSSTTIQPSYTTSTVTVSTPTTTGTLIGNNDRNTVSNSVLAQAPTKTLKGNNSGSTANVSDLTVSQTLTMLGAFSIASQQVQTSTQTYTPTSGMKYVRVICTAAGGNGGQGGNGAGNSGASGGSGGAGETRIGVFSASTIGSSQTVTIGATGSNTTFGSLLTAVSGTTGNNAAGQTPGGSGAGGTGGSGGLGIPGGAGAPGIPANNNTPNATGVTGGSSYWGGGGSGGVQAAAGGAGSAFGSGGGSGGGSTAASPAGGSGAGGICMENEYE